MVFEVLAQLTLGAMMNAKELRWVQSKSLLSLPFSPGLLFSLSDLSFGLPITSIHGKRSRCFRQFTNDFFGGLSSSGPVTRAASHT